MNRDRSTHFLGRPAPIYMLGDSQCLVFNHLLFEAQHQDQHYSLITQARYCPGLAAHTFANAPEHPQVRLHETLLRALLSDCLIDRDNRALYQFESRQAGILNLLAGRVAASPVLVFFCGSADLVNIFLRHLGNAHDFFLPDQEQLLAATPDPGPRKVFPYETARTYLQDLLHPLFRGLRHLQSLGFAHLFLHDLVPQTPDDDDYERIYGYRCPLRVRTKALLLMNQLLAERAAQQNVGMLKTWDRFTEHNLRRSEFGLDSIHLNKKAALISVETLWQAMCQDLPAMYLSDSDQTQARIESLQELTLQLAHGALQGHFEAVVALWEKHHDLWDWLSIHQERVLAQTTPLVSALHALGQALWALGRPQAFPPLLSRFKHTVYHHRPQLRPGDSAQSSAKVTPWEELKRYTPERVDAFFVAALQLTQTDNLLQGDQLAAG